VLIPFSNFNTSYIDFILIKEASASLKILDSAMFIGRNSELTGMHPHKALFCI